MFGPKAILALSVCLAGVYNAVAEHEIHPFLSSVMERLKDLDKLHDMYNVEEQMSRLASEVSDLEPEATGAAEEAEEEAADRKKAAESGSREEMETPQTGVVDGSASQEKPSAPEDSDEDDSDETGLELVPVRGLSSLFGFHTLFGMSKPWWTGPNVCVDRDEKEDKDSAETDSFISFGSAQFSNCINTPEKYSCKTITRRNGVTKTSEVSYHCCHGYRRTRPNQNCTKVETKPVLDLARELGAEKFADLAQAEGMTDVLNSKVTIFLPTDSALDEHHEKMDSLNSLDPVMTNEVPNVQQTDIKNAKAFVSGHIVNGVYTLADLEDDQVLTTLDNSTLRIGVLFGGRQILVNCAKLNETDKLTENGIVHLVDGTLTPSKNKISDILEEERFSQFKKLLEENDLWDLMSKDRTLTVFAVENEGVENMKKNYQMCTPRILAHHILPHALCSAMGESGKKLATIDLAKSWLTFSLSDDGKFTIGNSTDIKQRDIQARNGIVHVANDFVIPLSARGVDEILKKTEHTEWMSILEKSGLLEDIFSTPNMTMFVPTNEAVKEAKLDELSADELKDIVKYHIGTASPSLTVETLLGPNVTITTPKSMFPGLLDREQLSADCTPITKVGGLVCNGLIHEVSKVLRAPKKSIYEQIQSNEELETLRKVLEGTDLEEELKSGNLGARMTFLAPSNAAFEKLKESDLEQLVSDKKAADQLLRSHILRDRVCCRDALPGSWPFVATVATMNPGTPAEVLRRGSTTVLAGQSVSTCDQVATDGILQIVNGVSLPNSRTHHRELILRRPNSEIILAGL